MRISDNKKKVWNCNQMLKISQVEMLIKKGKLWRIFNFMVLTNDLLAFRKRENNH